MIRLIPTLSVSRRMPTGETKIPEPIMPPTTKQIPSKSPISRLSLTSPFVLSEVYSMLFVFAFDFPIVVATSMTSVIYKQLSFRVFVRSVLSCLGFVLLLLLYFFFLFSLLLNFYKFKLTLICPDCTSFRSTIFSILASNSILVSILMLI